MTASREVRRAANSTTLDRVARMGLGARATVYLLLGVLALLLALGERGQETDQRGALQTVAQHTGGYVVILVIGVGLVAYALWQFLEAVTGVPGDDGVTQRVSAVSSGVVYSALAVSAFTILFEGHDQSQANQQQSLSAKFMQHTFGRWLVGIVGIVFVVVGAVMIYQGVTRSFDKQLRLAEMSHGQRRVVEVLGVTGSVARGVVVGLSGVLVLVAAITFEPSKARGIDGALRALRRLPYGPWLLGLIAIGVIMFGLFAACETRWRRVN